MRKRRRASFKPSRLIAAFQAGVSRMPFSVPAATSSSHRLENLECGFGGIGVANLSPSVSETAPHVHFSRMKCISHCHMVDRRERGHFSAARR
jgi:hypothetical protein